MKISGTPTNNILVKAFTDSQCDRCNFAIVSCGEGWTEQMEKRLDAVRSVQGAEDFISIEFGDYGAAFYTSHEGEAEELPAGNDWSFVELDENETDKFSEPESRLSYGVMVVHNGARGCYRMYGKHTNDEYYTEELPFGEIVEQIRNHTGSLATTSNISIT